MGTNRSDFGKALEKHSSFSSRGAAKSDIWLQREAGGIEWSGRKRRRRGPEEGGFPGTVTALAAAAPPPSGPLHPAPPPPPSHPRRRRSRLDSPSFRLSRRISATQIMPSHFLYVFRTPQSVAETFLRRS